MNTLCEKKLNFDFTFYYMYVHYSKAFCNVYSLESNINVSLKNYL